MKKSANSNMYEEILIRTWDQYAIHLTGSQDGLVCVISNDPLEEAAYRALSSAISALGYGTSAITFLVLQPNNNAESEQKDALRSAGGSGLGSASESGGGSAGGSEQRLSGQGLFAALEGLDPLCVIVTDKDAAAACEAAYHCELPLLERARLLGRDIVAFKNFCAMLQDDQNKQKAWGLLKRLPRLDS